MNKTKLIAEIGWNHMGDMELAKEMVFAANESGADYAKFQTWSVQRLKNGSWDKDGRIEIYKKAELSLDNHLMLREYCESIGIEFMSSVFSVADAELLKQVTTDVVKIPSAESRNDELLKYCFDNFNHIYLSTGTSSFDEIRAGLNGKSIKNLTLLHCVSSYPCNLENSNINRINHLKRLQWPVGISDHYQGLYPSIFALGKGIDVIEKHFTIDNSLPGRDNEFAILPPMMKEMRKYIDASNKVKSMDIPDFQECEVDVRENYTGRFDG